MITIPNDITFNEQVLTFKDFLASILVDPQWGSKYSLIEINNSLRHKFKDKAPEDTVELTEQELSELKKILENPTNKYNLNYGIIVLDFFRVFMLSK